MKIKSVDSFLLTVPYDTKGGYHFIAGRPSAGLTMLLVRMRTDDGAEGWGEAFGHAVAPATKTALDTIVAPIFIGRDPADIAGLMREAQHKLHIFGRSGPVMYALSGIDIALWDLAGKHAAKPVYELLGHAWREIMPVYASLLRCADPPSVARSCANALERGYRAIKLHEITVPAIQAAREAVGPDVPLMVDTNCPWTRTQAREMVKALKPFDLHWLEEPLWPPEDFAGLAELRRQGGVISAGENVSGPHEFAAMIAARAVDIGQPSVSKIGGITAIREILTHGATAGTRIVCHCGYLGAGFLATLHLTAGLPEGEWVERLSIDVADSPYGAWAEPENGHVRLPTGPGLGCDPDMALVKRYSIAGPTE